MHSPWTAGLSISLKFKKPLSRFSSLPKRFLHHEWSYLRDGLTPVCVFALPLGARYEGRSPFFPLPFPFVRTWLPTMSMPTPLYRPPATTAFLPISDFPSTLSIPGLARLWRCYSPERFVNHELLFPRMRPATFSECDHPPIRTPDSSGPPADRGSTGSQVPSKSAIFYPSTFPGSGYLFHRSRIQLPEVRPSPP